MLKENKVKRFDFDSIVCLAPAYSDSDSEWSSLERNKVADVFNKGNKKSASHKRIRKKRTAIPVATPKVPSLASIGSADAAHNYSIKDDKSWRVDSMERGQCSTKNDSFKLFSS